VTHKGAARICHRDVDYILKLSHQMAASDWGQSLLSTIAVLECMLGAADHLAAGDT